MIREACVHGRFQPFHNEHLSYVLAAKELCEFLWIGIARPDPPTGTSIDQSHRERLENNPLMYYERVRLVSAVLLHQGLTCSCFGVVPFPIDQPELLPNYVPTTVHCFTTVNDQWNHEKNQTLVALGYSVTVLWERPKSIHGSALRAMIVDGDPDWRSLVPAPSAALLTQWGIETRLRQFFERKALHSG